jgi:hypothetical protein
MSLCYKHDTGYLLSSLDRFNCAFLFALMSYTKRLARDVIITLSGDEIIPVYLETWSISHEMHKIRIQFMIFLSAIFSSTSSLSLQQLIDTIAMRISPRVFLVSLICQRPE